MALPTLEDALDRWEPRLLANGVDPSDLKRVRAVARDWRTWFAAMLAVGGEYESLGKEALAEGRSLTAGESLVRAALLYHFAQFALFDFPDLRKEGHHRKVTAFLAALPLLKPPVERFTVPFGPVALPVHLRIPAGGVRSPWVLLVPGLDSTKEEFHTFEALFLARGMAVASFDGPGQGETAAAGRPWRPGDEVAVVTVFDALRERSELDPGRGSLVGVSFGGYLASAASAIAGARVGACASIGGCFSMGEGDWERLPLLIQEDFRHFCGATNLVEAQGVGSKVTLAEKLPTLEAPLLFVHGTRDGIFPADHAQRSAALCGDRATLLLLEGGSHVCNNMALRYRPFVADWVVRQLPR